MSRHVFILMVCLVFAAVLALDRMDAMRKTLDRIADNLQGLAFIKIGSLDQEPFYRVPEPAPEPFHYLTPPDCITYRLEVLDGTNVIWREGMEAAR
ncbi:MAG: hypothetical protein IJK04_05905 [Kiritimatiellae bacterium]|nr:hypothetical protein [Kiritimatiellia bacterium]